MLVIFDLLFTEGETHTFKTERNEASEYLEEKTSNEISEVVVSEPETSLLFEQMHIQIKIDEVNTKQSKSLE